MDYCSEKANPSVERPYQYHLRLVGNAGVGKSALISRINRDTFSSTFPYERHIACDWLRTGVETETARITLLYCDTAWQERFGRLQPNFYRRAQCVCVIFDLTDASSLAHAADWLHDVAECASLAVKFLVGNKCDLEKGRIDHAAAASLAKNFGARYFEVSAASGENVYELLAAIARDTHAHAGASSGPDATGVNIRVKTRKRCY